MAVCVTTMGMPQKIVNENQIFAGLEVRQRLSSTTGEYQI
jgi:hypothetical protein